MSKDFDERMAAGRAKIQELNADIAAIEAARRKARLKSAEEVARNALQLKTKQEKAHAELLQAVTALAEDVRDLRAVMQESVEARKAPGVVEFVRDAEAISQGLSFIDSPHNRRN